MDYNKTGGQNWVQNARKKHKQTENKQTENKRQKDIKQSDIWPRHVNS